MPKSILSLLLLPLLPVKEQVWCGIALRAIDGVLQDVLVTGPDGLKHLSVSAYLHPSNHSGNQKHALGAIYLSAST